MHPCVSQPQFTVCINIFLQVWARLTNYACTLHDVTFAGITAGQFWIQSCMNYCTPQIKYRSTSFTYGQNWQTCIVERAPPIYRHVDMMHKHAAMSTLVTKTVHSVLTVYIQVCLTNLYKQGSNISLLDKNSRVRTKVSLKCSFCNIFATLLLFTDLN